MVNQNKILGLIGLSAKAGKVEFGTDAVENAIKKHKVKLVIVATDAADRTKENFEFLCKKSSVNFIAFGMKDEISKAIGKNNKAVIGIKDINLSNEIYKIICGGEAIG